MPTKELALPGRLPDKKLTELRNAIVDELVERGFIDDNDGLRTDIGDLIESNVDFVLGRK